MKGNVEAEIRREFEKAKSLLEQFMGTQFKPPELYIGDRHQSRFITISSLKDITYVSMVRGAYDDEINGMFVPDSIMMEEDDVANRIFTFIHECVHALSTEQNLQLKRANIGRFTQSKSEQLREKGYVYVVFDEGLATYLAIQVCLQSGRSDLVEKAEQEHEGFLAFFNEWTSSSSRHFVAMARAYKLDPNNWEEIIERYLAGEIWVGLSAYKYDIGYYFMRTLQPDAPKILRMISRPPETIRHIVYPETYISTFIEE